MRLIDDDLQVTQTQDPPTLNMNASLAIKNGRKRKRETFINAWNANDSFLAKQIVTRPNNDYVVLRPTAPVAPIEWAQSTH